MHSLLSFQVPSLPNTVWQAALSPASSTCWTQPPTETSLARVAASSIAERAATVANSRKHSRPAAVCRKASRWSETQDEFRDDVRADRPRLPKDLCGFVHRLKSRSVESSAHCQPPGTGGGWVSARHIYKRHTREVNGKFDTNLPSALFGGIFIRRECKVPPSISWHPAESFEHSGLQSRRTLPDAQCFVRRADQEMTHFPSLLRVV